MEKNSEKNTKNDLKSTKNSGKSTKNDLKINEKLELIPSTIQKINGKLELIPDITLILLWHTPDIEQKKDRFCLKNDPFN